MTKYVSEEAIEFRKLVVSLEGNRELIAMAIGRTPTAVSHRLNSELHGAWWRAYKKRRAVERARARHRRARQKAKERGAAWAGGHGWEPGSGDRIRG